MTFSSSGSNKSRNDFACCAAMIFNCWRIDGSTLIVIATVSFMALLYMKSNQQGILIVVKSACFKKTTRRIRLEIDQLGRRNLHPDQASYLRGKRYNGEKKAVPNASGKNQYSEVGYQNDTQPKTHERLAEEYKVGPATIARDGQYAAAVDKLADAGIEPQSVISHVAKKAVIETANTRGLPKRVAYSVNASHNCTGGSRAAGPAVR